MDQELNTVTKVINTLKNKPIIKYKDRWDIRCKYCKQYYSLSDIPPTYIAYICNPCHNKPSSELYDQNSIHCR